MKLKLLLFLFSFISINYIKTIMAAQPQKSERSIEERLSGYFQNDNFIDLLKLKTLQEIKNAMNQEFSYEKMDFDTNKKIEKKYKTWFTCTTEFKSIKIIFILLLIQHSNNNTSLSEIITQIHAITNEPKKFIINKIQEACDELKTCQQSKSQKNIELIKNIKNNGHEILIQRITCLYYQTLTKTQQQELLKKYIDTHDLNTLDQLLSIHCPEPINDGFFEYSESLLDYAIQHKKSACIPTLLKHGIKTINPKSYKHISTTKNIESDGTISYKPIISTGTHGDSPFGSDDESQEIYNHSYEYKLNSWTPARNSALVLSALASVFTDIYTFEKAKPTKEKKTKKNTQSQEKIKTTKQKQPKKADITTKIEQETEVETKEKEKTTRLNRFTRHINEWRKDLWNHPSQHKKLLIPLVSILGLRLFKDSIPGLNNI